MNEWKLAFSLQDIQYSAWNQSLLMKSLYVMQEGELNQADKYAEVALQADRFNPSGESFYQTIDNVLILCIDYNFTISKTLLWN